MVAGSLWTEVSVLPEVASTNAVLARRARVDARAGLVVLTEYQSAGRGRLDRAWTAPPRTGLLFSALVRPRAVPSARWSWLPLLAGLAVATAVRGQGGDATVKWPNDVLIADRKLAGILVERIDSGAGPAAVIGVGVNVSLRSADLPTPNATSLALEGLPVDRSRLAVDVLRELGRLLTGWQAAGGAAQGPLREGYVAASSTLGRRVRVLGADGTTRDGEAVGVDDGGRLLLAIGGRTVALAAGDVTHLRAAP